MSERRSRVPRAGGLHARLLLCAIALAAAAVAAVVCECASATGPPLTVARLPLRMSTVLPSIAYAGILIAASVLRSYPIPLNFLIAGATALLMFVGIYNAWVLRLSGGETLNQRLGTGAFRGYGAGVSLIRRF